MRSYLEPQNPQNHRVVFKETGYNLKDISQFHEYTGYKKSSSSLKTLLNLGSFEIPQLAIYKWYTSGIYCQLGDYIYIYITYHLLREPETTIDPG